MHIPASMLQGAVCPVTAAAAVAGTGLAFHYARKADDKPSAMKFASVTAMIFAFQMLNVTVQDGTSGHLMGGVLAAALLGVPYAVISMAVVLTVQAVFFADGGINALGANIINMAFIGAGGAGLLFSWLLKRGMPRPGALATAAWVSVVAAAVACSVELAWSGAVPLAKVLPAMLSVHTLIGVGEVIITAGVLVFLGTARRSSDMMAAAVIFALAVTAAFLSPFASAFPDGLEYVAANLDLAQFSAASMSAWFSDYRVSWIAGERASTVAAGLAGIMIVWAAAHAAVRYVKSGQVAR